MLLPADREWVRANEAGTLSQIEIATRRMITLRSAGGGIARAAQHLGLSHDTLSEWRARRTLPDMSATCSPTMLIATLPSPKVARAHLSAWICATTVACVSNSKYQKAIDQSDKLNNNIASLTKTLPDVTDKIDPCCEP